MANGPTGEAKTVKFTAMEAGDQADYDLLEGFERQYADGLGLRLMDTLARLEGSMGGYKISRLQHSLQSATRARNDGADIDWVVATLVHDIGDELAPYNHSDLAATVLRPYVRQEVTWVVEQHGLFQSYYYDHFYGQDRNKRDQYRDHQWFQLCVDFCARWDQPSFDPDYPTDSLSSFRAEVLEVFARKEWDPAVVASGPAALY